MRKRKKTFVSDFVLLTKLGLTLTINVIFSHYINTFVKLNNSHLLYFIKENKKKETYL